MSTSSRAPKAVLTFVTPAERLRVDAVTTGVANGRYCTVHRETLEELIVDLRTRQVSAVIVSVSRYQHQYAPAMARLVREFPGVPAVALLTANEVRSSSALLSLGEHGVRQLVDARDPAGWRELRAIVCSEHSGEIDTRAIHALRQDLEGAIEPAVRFFDTLFSIPRTLTTVRQLARHVGITPTTFMSRFFRQQLPPAKRYLAMARLVRTAHLLESPGYSITQVAFLMEYSSPQSFSRHLATTLHMGAAEFRRRHSGESMLAHFREELVRPHLPRLRRFDPFHSPPSWITERYRKTMEVG